MEVTLSGMVMLVRDLQEANALSPMEVTLFGTVMLSRAEQDSNAFSPMDMMPSGMA